METFTKRSVLPIVGMTHRGMENFVRDIPAGEPLTVEREPNNKFDRNALKVVIRGQHVGYIPKHIASLVAKDMDLLGQTTMPGKLAFDGGPKADVERTKPKPEGG